MNTHYHAATPTLSVIDPRALVIRDVGYCRHPDSPLIDPRITRQRFDAAGRLSESWDPRLWGTATKPNLATVHGLSNQPLLTDSVDAGWQLSLLDQSGSPRSFWDARGSQRHTDYDVQRRPVAVTEQAIGDAPRVVERLNYGDSAPAIATRNQCGRLLRHDDPAGTQVFPEYGLSGSVLREERRFLIEVETPDWPIELDARDEWLEDQSFITSHTFNPTNELERQTDAMGNIRAFGYDVAGKLSEAWLQLAGESKTPQCLVSHVRYNAHDQVESETAGNGVVTLAVYGADDSRLIRLVAGKRNQKPLQDLSYVYDAVGNILALEDQSQPVTHFNNQRIEPINRYRYDSLYQLVEAKGWEVAKPSHGAALPDLLPTPLDPNQRRNYTQRFEYDRAGNLITRHHSDAPVFSMFTSARNNRSLSQREDGSLPGEADIAMGFDTCGNQLELQRGQTMAWDIRNQLSRVTLVTLENEPDDYECYRYDRPGHRLRKVSVSQARNRTLRTEVRYLPNLEFHRQADGEEHHVVSIEAGRSTIRALHWPAGTHDDHLRYSLSDHLGSSTLELDNNAGVLTQEHYYPFGGTACWAGKSALVANYKTIRYSGKERDATGLYYYGYRYYAPWLHRWISTDPEWDVDGVNFYLFCANNPINYRDALGLEKGRGDFYEITHSIFSGKVVARGMEEIKAVIVERWQRLDAGVKKASEWLAQTISSLETETVDEDVRQISNLVFFGNVPVPELVSKVRVIDGAVKEFAEGNRDFVLFESKKNSIDLAHIMKGDPHKRIFLSTQVLDQTPEQIAMTILHEASHFTEKYNNEVIPGSLDFLTTGFGVAIADKDKPDKKLSTEEEVDRLIAQQSVVFVTADKRQKFFKSPWKKGIEKALNKNPELRTKVLFNNADSLAMFITSVGTR